MQSHIQALAGDEMTGEMGFHHKIHGEKSGKPFKIIETAEVNHVMFPPPKHVMFGGFFGMMLEDQSQKTWDFSALHPKQPHAVGVDGIQHFMSTQIYIYIYHNIT